MFNQIRRARRELLLNEDPSRTQELHDRITSSKERLIQALERFTGRRRTYGNIGALNSFFDNVPIDSNGDGRIDYRDVIHLFNTAPGNALPSADRNLPQNTALIIVDGQVGFTNPAWGSRNNPQALENMARLIQEWRRAGRPIIHIQHASIEPGSTLSPGQPGYEFQELVRPRQGETVIRKHANNSFEGTNLEYELRRRGIYNLVLCGISNDHCVNTTTRVARNRGFSTYVVSDATYAFQRTNPSTGEPIPAQVISDSALASLSREFATILTTDQMLRLLQPLGIPPALEPTYNRLDVAA